MRREIADVARGIFCWAAGDVRSRQLVDHFLHVVARAVVLCVPSIASGKQCPALPRSRDRRLHDDTHFSEISSSLPPGPQYPGYGGCQRKTVHRKSGFSSVRTGFSLQGIRRGIVAMTSPPG